MTVVMVTGSRHWPMDHFGLLLDTLDELFARRSFSATPFRLIEGGGARGADSQALVWAELHESVVAHTQFPARWTEHAAGWCPGDWCHRRGYCVGAGPRRNQSMIDFPPDIVLAFKEGFDHTLKKGGTEDAVRRAKDARIPVQITDPAVRGSGFSVQTTLF